MYGPESTPSHPPGRADNAHAGSVYLQTYPQIDKDAPIPRYGVTIGAIGLLAPQGIATEAMPIPELYPLPHVPGWFLGIAHRRGDLVPVFDPRRLWFPGQPPQSPRTLWIVDKGEAAAGLLIDGLPHALRTDHKPGDIPPVPAALAGFASQPRRQGETYYWEFRHTDFFLALRTAIAAG